MNWKRLVALAACVPGAFAAFGVTTGSSYLDVDTGGGLVFRGERDEPDMEPCGLVYL